MRSALYRISTVSTLLCLLGLGSCDLNKIDFTATDSKNVDNEAASDSYFEDVTDISTTTVSVPSETDGGRVFTIAGDSRFACATITLDIDNGSTIQFPKGMITIDFMSGCADGRGNTRKGKILIAYAGRRFLPGSSITTTFDGYTINGITLEGTHIATSTFDSNEANPKFTLSLLNGKLTWPDGTVATREMSRTRTWIRTVGGAEDKWYVAGAATGTNRQQYPYSITITDTLIYQKACVTTHAKFMPSQGKEDLIVSNKMIALDFGTGSCDEIVTLTINGKSTQVNLVNSD